MRSEGGQIAGVQADEGDGGSSCGGERVGPLKAARREGGVRDNSPCASQLDCEVRCVLRRCAGRLGGRGVWRAASNRGGAADEGCLEEAIEVGERRKAVVGARGKHPPCCASLLYTQRKIRCIPRPLRVRQV